MQVHRLQVVGICEFNIFNEKEWEYELTSRMAGQWACTHILCLLGSMETIEKIFLGGICERNKTRP